MSGQTSAIPHDSNGEPIGDVIPSSHGALKCYRLTVPAGSSRKLSLATNYPAESASKGAPELISWALVLNVAGTVWVGGSDVAADLGIPLTCTGVGSPNVLGWKSDPELTYVYNPLGVAVDLTLALTGKLT